MYELPVPKQMLLRRFGTCPALEPGAVWDVDWPGQTCRSRGSWG